MQSGLDGRLSTDANEESTDLGGGVPRYLRAIGPYIYALRVRRGQFLDAGKGVVLSDLGPGCRVDRPAGVKSNGHSQLRIAEIMNHLVGPGPVSDMFAQFGRFRERKLAGGVLFVVPAPLLGSC